MPSVLVVPLAQVAKRRRMHEFHALDRQFPRVSAEAWRAQCRAEVAVSNTQLGIGRIKRGIAPTMTRVRLEMEPSRSLGLSAALGSTPDLHLPGQWPGFVKIFLLIVNFCI